MASTDYTGSDYSTYLYTTQLSASQTMPMAYASLASGFLPVTGGTTVSGSVVTYRMRAYDTSLLRYVYWTASLIDSSASSYTGPGPVNDIVWLTT